MAEAGISLPVWGYTYVNAFVINWESPYLRIPTKTAQRFSLFFLSIILFIRCRAAKSCTYYIFVRN